MRALFERRGGPSLDPANPLARPDDGSEEHRCAVIVETVMRLAYNLMAGERGARAGEPPPLWAHALADSLRCLTANVEYKPCPLGVHVGGRVREREREREAPSPAPDALAVALELFGARTLELIGEYDVWRGGFYAYSEVVWRRSALELVWEAGARVASLADALAEAAEDHAGGGVGAWRRACDAAITDAAEEAENLSAESPAPRGIPRSTHWWFWPSHGHVTANGC